MNGSRHQFLKVGGRDEVSDCVCFLGCKINVFSQHGLSC